MITCCCFDLETSSLNADFGIVLCGVVQGDGKKPRIFRGDEINPHWRTKRSDDKALVKAIVRELEQYDIWIAHNGAKFDVPFLRTRLMAWGLPPLATKKLVDPVWLARNKLRLSYNSLKQVAAHLGIEQRKTEVTPQQWLRAYLDGDTRAMNYIVEHCVLDVEILAQVINNIKHYATQLNSWGSGF